MTWIAEVVPWYSVDPKTRRWTMTDEDYAMSAPEALGEFGSRQDAGVRVATHLEFLSGMTGVSRRGKTELYMASARAMLMGADGVRILGRFYRVREV